MCETVRPTFCAMSSNCGTRSGEIRDCAGGGVRGAVWASAIAARNRPMHRPSRVRIGGRVFRLYRIPIFERREVASDNKPFLTPDLAQGISRSRCPSVPLGG